ncbi:MAG: hypothetical protein VX589_08295 [Myxococcota bacterium]|nr:hypothetical protein [Myxococcota bacterium]
MNLRPKLKIIARIEGEGPSVLVTERGDYRSLCFADDASLVQGAMHRRDHLRFRSEYFQQQVAAAVFHPRPRTALFLGLGIGAVARLCRAIWPDLHVDAVEICDTVVEAATGYFGLEPTPKFRIHVVDATQVVQRKPLHGVYDLVFADCYTSKSIAPECLEHSFLVGCIKCLSSSGLLITNLLPNRSGARAMAKNVQAQIAEPWLMRAQKKNNHTVFGHPTAQLSLSDALVRAHAIDQDNRLPFKLVPEVMGAVKGSQVLGMADTW